MQTIGTCSLCGGPVQIPQMWGGSVPPVPTCARCGSIVARAYGPVIPMRRPQRSNRNATTETVLWSRDIHEQ